MNKYIHTCTQNYELIHIITYIPELLKFLQYIKIFLSLYNIRMVKRTRKENNTNTKKEAFYDYYL